MLKMNESDVLSDDLLSASIFTPATMTPPLESRQFCPATDSGIFDFCTSLISPLVLLFVVDRYQEVARVPGAQSLPS
jgi:hypothetical protein